MDRHPSAILRDEEDLAEALDRYLSSDRVMPRAAYDEWSTWDFDAWQIMHATALREQARRQKEVLGG